MSEQSFVESCQQRTACIQQKNPFIVLSVEEQVAAKLSAIFMACIRELLARVNTRKFYPQYCQHSPKSLSLRHGPLLPLGK